MVEWLERLFPDEISQTRTVQQAREEFGEWMLGNTSIDILLNANKFKTIVLEKIAEEVKEDRKIPELLNQWAPYKPLFQNLERYHNNFASPTFLKYFRFILFMTVRAFYDIDEFVESRAKRYKAVLIQHKDGKHKVIQRNKEMYTSNMKKMAIWEIADVFHIFFDNVFQIPFLLRNKNTVCSIRVLWDEADFPDCWNDDFEGTLNRNMFVLKSWDNKSRALLRDVIIFFGLPEHQLNKELWFTKDEYLRQVFLTVFKEKKVTGKYLDILKKCNPAIARRLKYRNLNFLLLQCMNRLQGVDNEGDDREERMWANVVFLGLVAVYMKDVVGCHDFILEFVSRDDFAKPSSQFPQIIVKEGTYYVLYKGIAYECFDKYPAVEACVGFFYIINRYHKGILMCQKMPYDVSGVLNPFDDDDDVGVSCETFNLLRDQYEFLGMEDEDGGVAEKVIKKNDPMSMFNSV